MSDTVLLVVDVQKGLQNLHPYNGEEVIANIRRVLDIAREKGMEVLYVRHDDGLDGELEYGTENYEICDEVAPKEWEQIFDKTRNSAFYGTGLEEYLAIRKVKNIIIVGMQTEYCIDATCKAAYEKGYNIYIPENTNTTFDNEYMTAKEIYQFFNYKIWDKRYAKVVGIEEIYGL